MQQRFSALGALISVVDRAAYTSRPFSISRMEDVWGIGLLVLNCSDFFLGGGLESVEDAQASSGRDPTVPQTNADRTVRSSI